MATKTKTEAAPARATGRVKVGDALWNDVMTFYIDEAWLLDERRFEEWLDLLTEDLFYFMPRRKNVTRRDLARELTSPDDMALYKEDKEGMRIRVARLATGMAWSEDPPSRTRHIVGNLTVEQLDGGEVKARSAFLAFKSHLETDQDLYSGYREDVLRRVGGQWKVARRTIVLDANVLMSKNLSVFF